MLTHKLIRLAALSGACALPTACATTSYSRSGVATLPAGVKGKAGANASIEIEGLKLHIESLDQATKGQTIPRLALRLAFDPRALGYSFDPAQVALRGRGGTTWRPLVPVEPRYQALVPGSSFDLAFDVAVTSDAQLELVLAGLARGPKRLDAVTLPLTRRNGRSIDRAYWLEAIGYGLALVTYPYGGM